MVNKFNSNYFIIIAISFSLFFGVLLRLYNLNYENLWFDEMVSFWVSEPFISFEDSYARNSSAEGTPFLFNFLLKNLHEIFGYHSHIGRYFSATFSILSILSMAYLSISLKKNNSFVLVIFLVSFNVFLIKYAQEARVYSFVFFLSTITIFFLIKLLTTSNNRNKKIINSLFYIIFQILAVMAHPFYFINFFSLIFYYFLYFIKTKKNLIFLNYTILTISLILFIYLSIYFSDRVQHPDSWVGNPELKFYTNFYFSSFFGSRILGLMHLVTLITLIFYYKKEIINKLNPKTLLIIIIFLTYFIPIIYGYMIRPVIFSRYIMFVLIPVIILLSYLIFEIKNDKIKKSLIIFFVTITFANQFTEYNFKQFYKERPKFKIDYSSAVKFINDSNYKNYFINHSLNAKEKIWSHVFNNYLSIFTKEKKIDIKQMNLSDLKNKKGFVWIICPKEFFKKECEKIGTNQKFKFKVLEDVEFNSLNLKLIKLE